MILYHELQGNDERMNSIGTCSFFLHQFNREIDMKLDEEKNMKQRF